MERPRYLLQDPVELLTNKAGPELPCFCFYGHQANTSVFEIHFIPGEPEDFSLSHSGIKGCGQDPLEV